MAHRFTRADDQPHALHLFTFLPSPSATLPGPISLVVTLQFSSAVRNARWHPRRSRRLAASTMSGNGVYLWDGDWVDDEDAPGAGEGTAEGVALPATVQPQDIRWSPEGEWLACVDRSTWCVVYEAG